MLIDLLKGNISQDDFILENNIRIVYKKLPKKIYGFIHRYRDINIIVINWNISKELKKRTLIHEFAHLELNHIDDKISLLNNNDNYIDANQHLLIEFFIQNVEDSAEKYLNQLKKYL